MKKSLIIMITLLVAGAAGLTCVFAAEYTKFSSKFVKNFKDCDAYQETTTSDFEGKTFTTTRKIIGWRNGFCKYQEIVTSANDKYQLNCSFPSIQVDELYEAMKDKSKEPEKYELEMFAEQKDPKTGKTKYAVVGTTTIKGNKAYLVWAKYQNSPYFCTPQKVTAPQK